MALAAPGSFTGTVFRTKSRPSHGISRGNRLVARASSLKLDKPERLWETGSLTWFHGAEPPAYLDGSLPGDRGFDPLRLGLVQPGFIAEKNRGLEWLLEGELYNGRLAMLAVPGILSVEALGKGPWWEAPFKVDYAPLLPEGPLKFFAVVAVGHALWGYLEYKRVQNFTSKGQTGLFTAPFDPLGLRNDYRRQSEVRNARLAMLANLGFWSQASVTGKGPLQNLSDHLADPVHNNILTQGKAGWYVFGGVLFFSLFINLLGFSAVKEDSKLRTVFSEFKV
ncbi:Chlorophyll a-b binding protein 8, chloroplastic [Coccomyxa sp. Obi]|nr:Chlorophyll a-b binding protein 8, chloroplastic [Coccomyxa sp. Obi]